MEPGSDLYPIAVLMDELKHEDMTLRLNALERISTIALALGPERTRSELIPFLNDNLDDEDEILKVIARELGNFESYVGGQGYLVTLLQPLQALAAVEEPLVREEACNSLCKIAKIIPLQDLETYFFKLVETLSEGSWFTNRASACNLFLQLFERNPKSSDKLLQLFSELVSDETPMVRRAAATNLSKLVGHIDTSKLNDAFELFKKLASDEQDSVRLLAVDVAVELGKRLQTTELSSQTFLFYSDKSWRVRYRVAQLFDGMISINGANNSLKPFVSLAKDNEQEVRTAIASQVGILSKMLSKEDIMHYIIPIMGDLIHDSSQHVRAAWALQVTSLAPLVGEEITIEQIMPMVFDLFKDDFPEVRLNIISKLDLINEIVGIEMLSKSLLPTIMALADDKQWRVRLAIIEHIPLLAQQLGEQFFQDQLSELCISWLLDSVYSIREAAIENVVKMIDVFGPEQAKKSIVPKILALSTRSNYLYRITLLICISKIVYKFDHDLIIDEILPVCEQLAEDKIPNIKFNLAKTYTHIIEHLTHLGENEKIINTRIVPILEILIQDEDVDVKYFAEKALLTVDRSSTE